MPRTRSNANHGARRSRPDPSRASLPPTPLTPVAGAIMWLPPMDEVPDSDRLTGLDVKGYDHPVVILSPSLQHDGRVVFLKLTSLGEVNLIDRHPGPHNINRRSQYLPIDPAETHPDLGILLSLRDPTTNVLAKKSYINTETRYSIRLAVLNPYSESPYSHRAQPQQQKKYVLDTRSYAEVVLHAGYQPLPTLVLPSPITTRTAAAVSGPRRHPNASHQYIPRTPAAVSGSHRSHSNASSHYIPPTPPAAIGGTSRGGGIVRPPASGYGTTMSSSSSTTAEEQRRERIVSNMPGGWQSGSSWGTSSSGTWSHDMEASRYREIVERHIQRRRANSDRSPRQPGEITWTELGIGLAIGVGVVGGAGYGIWTAWVYRGLLCRAALNGAVWVARHVLEVGKELVKFLGRALAWLGGKVGSLVKSAAGMAWEMLKEGVQAAARDA